VTRGAPVGREYPPGGTRLGRLACGGVGLLVGTWFALQGMVVLAFGRGSGRLVEGVAASLLAIVVLGLWAFQRPAAPGWRAALAVALVPLYLVATLLL
jgi:hypothetical protein